MTPPSPQSPAAKCAEEIAPYIDSDRMSSFISERIKSLTRIITRHFPEPPAVSHCDSCDPSFTTCWNDGSKCCRLPPLPSSQSDTPMVDEHGNTMPCIYRLKFDGGSKEYYFYTEETYRTLERELNEANETINTLHRLMVTAEKRGADKANQELTALKLANGKKDEVIRDAQMHIEADNIDWARLNRGPDHDPNYKPEFPEIVQRLKSCLSDSLPSTLYERYVKMEKALEKLSEPHKFAIRSDIKSLDRVQQLATSALNQTEGE